MHLQDTAIVATLMFFAGCGASPSVDGRVLTPSGEPLSDVSVRVLKSTYQAKSQADGGYSVPFAPGTFSVEYTKSGHTTHVLELDIQQATVFPAENVTLYPVPEEVGIHLLGKSGLTRLVESDIDVQQASSVWTRASKFFCTGEGAIEVPAGDVVFVDTSPEVLLPAKLGGYGLIYETPTPVDQTTFNGVFKDTKDTVGKEAQVIRTFTATAGQYAWVHFSKNRQGELELDGSKPCLPFKVTPTPQ